MKLDLLTRRECWTLSLRGKLLVLSLAMAFAITAPREAYPFLAVNQPVDGEVLIVEGWIPMDVYDQAAAEFKRGHYRRVLVVGTTYDEQYKWAVNRLVKHGVPRQFVDTVVCPEVQKDRTYHAALGTKDWFIENGIRVKSFTVATLGPHARRSRLMYEKAFGDSAEVGIVALNDASYDSKLWWRTSHGVTEVSEEAIGYVYARFFFAWE